MTSKPIAALVTSHMDGDDEQFLSIVLQYAAREAREGRAEDAEQLKKLVQTARNRRRAETVSGQTPIPMARPRGELQGLVSSSYPTTTLASMVLSEELRERLSRIVQQQEARATLRDHGQAPATHVLLVGPPGTGKTMTAASLAGELRLPLFTVRLEGLFSRFLGETAAKLRLLFDQVAQIRGVYLLDEFDAIGARRAERNDVGEVRRVLNSVLGFMEEPNATDSLVIAATNQVEILDSALARRFDEVVEYAVPDALASRAIIERRLGKFGLKGKSWTKILSASKGLSQAELCRAADHVVKDAILAGVEKVTSASLEKALKGRQAVQRRFRRLNEQ